jgi:signal peptidase I
VSSSQRRGLAGILVLAVLVLFWVYFAPVQLGGSTYYSATVGISMEPLFHKGDLAIVRRSSSYRVGEIVLYESAILHRPVLHRIFVIQNGHYFFKGDNNDFVDPGYATSSDLLGKLWIHVPKAGRILSWFGAPAHTALLGGVAATFLFMGGFRKKKRRRRKRSGAGYRPVQ